jgi:two-component system cell cycle response regulator
MPDGDAPLASEGPSTAPRPDATDSPAAERPLFDALQELRIVAAELRAGALATSGAELDPGQVLDASRAIDRIAQELAQSQSALRALAETDPLTGLANLRAFRSRLDEEVKRARRYRTALTCVMADMDYLKAINDQLGHAAGDTAISAVARTISEELRETDFGARYGGDEFVVLMPHTGKEEGRILAERICSRLRRTPLEAGGRRILLAASFGVAELGATPDGDSAGLLLRLADAALYDAKHAGRGRVAVATEAA